MPVKRDSVSERGRATTRGTPNRGTSNPRGHTPGRLSMPERGSPQDLGPRSVERHSKSPDRSPQISPGASTEVSPNVSRSPSPIRIGESSTKLSENWLSMKYPDMLSASDRVLHHNMGVIAGILDSHQKALVKYASVRTTGKTAMAREPEAPAVATKVSTSVPTNVATNVAANVATNVASKVATKDKEACDKLGEETFTGILREMLNVLKGELGTDTLTGKKGKPALKQAEHFLQVLATRAEFDQEQSAEAMDTGDGGNPLTSQIHALAASLSSSALEEWYLKLTKGFGLSPKRGAPKKAKGDSKSDVGKRKRQAEADDDDVDEAEEAAGEEAAAAGMGSPAKKTRTDVASSRVTVEIEDDDDDSSV